MDFHHLLLQLVSVCSFIIVKKNQIGPLHCLFLKSELFLPPKTHSGNRAQQNIWV